ncbi:unnamed protein product [Bemisia tabaci]|uniref:Double jelly roll-like domain-containing protein n=1 Tax=Bemisia tabaci TaxID=7038 RepID=A0A9P0AM04_BEMTA|nr:unnamed protein product [Bemisia tabaci]
MSAETRALKYYQLHTYQAYNPSFKNNDEIRIPVNSQDLITVPGYSKLYVEGTIKFTPKVAGVKADGVVCNLSNNAVAYLFDQVSYEVNGVEVDRTRKVGVTSTANVLLTRTKEEAAALKLAGWNSPIIDEANNTFYALVPLDMLLGVFGDYKDPLIRVRQELVLVRSRTNKDSYEFTSGADKEDVSLTLTKVQWQMPQIKYNLATEKSILDKVKSNASFQIAFRSFETHVYPQLPVSSKETWKLMTTTNVEAPSYIVVLFQTNRSDNENRLDNPQSEVTGQDLENSRNGGVGDGAIIPGKSNVTASHAITILAGEALKRVRRTEDPYLYVAPVASDGGYLFEDETFGEVKAAHVEEAAHVLRQSTVNS